MGTTSTRLRSQDAGLGIGRFIRPDVLEPIDAPR